MTDNHARANENIDAMLDMVKRRCEEQCRLIDAEAADQADDIVNRAYKDARAKVHDVIAEERRNARRDIDKQRAQIETAKRQNFQDRENAFLDAVWQNLEHELVSRWNDAGARHMWLSGAIDRALAHLQSGVWRVEYPQNWSVDELKPFSERIKGVSAQDIELIPTADFDVGLRIQANGVIVDATLVGVLSDQNEISAMLLAELFEDAEVSS